MNATSANEKFQQLDRVIILHATIRGRRRGESLRQAGLKTMMGHREVEQAALFYEFSFEGPIPGDHLLRSIDRFVELDELRPELFLQWHRTTATAQNLRKARETDRDAGPDGDLSERLEPALGKARS